MHRIGLQTKQAIAIRGTAVSIDRNRFLSILWICPCVLLANDLRCDHGIGMGLVAAIVVSRFVVLVFYWEACWRICQFYFAIPALFSVYLDGEIVR